MHCPLCCYLLPCEVNDFGDQLMAIDWWFLVVNGCYPLLQVLSVYYLFPSYLLLSAAVSGMGIRIGWWLRVVGRYGSDSLDKLALYRVVELFFY